MDTFVWISYEQKKIEIYSTVLDGNSKMGTHVRSNLCYLICLQHLIRSDQIRAVIKLNSFPLRIKTPMCVHMLLSVVSSFKD